MTIKRIDATTMTDRRCLLLAALLSGCVAEYGPLPYEAPAAFRVTYDTECEAPTDADRAMLRRAAQMWETFGVEVSEDIDGAPLTLCLHQGRLEGNKGGWAEGPDGRGVYLIIVDRTPASTQYYYGTLAHEIGHLALWEPGLDDHLSPEQTGIMSSAVRCPDSAPPYECAWSEDDIAHLQLFGLVREEDA